MQGDDSKFHALFRLLPPHTALAHLPQRTFRGNQGCDRGCVVGLHHRGHALQTLQRILRRFLSKKEGAHGVLRLLLHPVCRLHLRLHPTLVHHRQDPSRRAFRSNHRGQLHRGHRRAAIIQKDGGHRLLRTEQQPVNGHRAYHRHLHLPTHPEF